MVSSPQYNVRSQLLSRWRSALPERFASPAHYLSPGRDGSVCDANRYQPGTLLTRSVAEKHNTVTTRPLRPILSVRRVVETRRGRPRCSWHPRLKSRTPRVGIGDVYSGKQGKRRPRATDLSMEKHLTRSDSINVETLRWWQQGMYKLEPRIHCESRTSLNSEIHMMANEGSSHLLRRLISSILFLLA